MYDESGLNYSDHVNNQTDCTDLGGSGGGGGIGGISGNGATPSSCLQLKAEPLGGPSSPESSSEPMGPDDCAGCGRLIQVRSCWIITGLCRPFKGRAPLALLYTNRCFFVLLFLSTQNRIAIICRLLKNGGTKAVYSAVNAINCWNEKHPAFHVMAIFIAKQTITGKTVSSVLFAFSLCFMRACENVSHEIVLPWANELNTHKNSLILLPIADNS